MPPKESPITLTQSLIQLHNINHDADVRSPEQAAASNTGLLMDALLMAATKAFRFLPVSKQLLGPPNEKEAIINSLLAQQKVATSYEEWKELSLKLDSLLGNDLWKQAPESDLYDHNLIKYRLEQLREARLEQDYKKLLYIIRTTWSRNLGKMGNVNNYRHSLVGTKKLIEEYLKECRLSIKCLLSESSDLDDRYFLGMLIQTRKAIGRTALVLSGGGCFGLIHIGVIATLLEQDLLPRIISGSSAGAIVASILSVHNPSEIHTLLADVLRKEFIIFTESAEAGEEQDKKVALFSHIIRFLKTGNWFDSGYLVETMKGFLGNLTFREGYNRTGRILNVTVSPVSLHEQPRLLNYITAPDVLIWSAVCASCSLPGVFESSSIYEKDSMTGNISEWNHFSTRFVDGSVDNDLPIIKLSEMFNVDHTIVCQVNPHVAPLLKLSLQCVGGEIEHELSARVKSYVYRAYNYWSTEFIHYLNICQEMGIARNLTKRVISVLSQRYSGDITILPDLRIAELNKILINPTPEFILDAAVRGARSTWPKIEIIRNHCGNEFLLDGAISELRSRLISKNINLSNELAVVNSPMSTSNEDIPAQIETRRGSVGRNRSESYSNAYMGVRSASHGNIKALHNQKIRRQSSISGLRNKHSKDSLKESLNNNRKCIDSTYVMRPKINTNSKKSFAPLDWDMNKSGSPLANGVKSNVFEASFKITNKDEEFEDDVGVDEFSSEEYEYFDTDEETKRSIKTTNF